MMKNKELAYAVLRVALGIDILMHGLSRFGENYGKFVASMMEMFATSPLPGWSVNILAHLIPIAEFAVGALLVIGLATRLAAVAGALLMMILIFGSALLQKWELVSLQMNYVFFYFLVLFFLEYNRYSLDRKFR